MASVYNRGTRSVPKFYGQVKLADGSWKCIRVHAKSKPAAREATEILQGRIDQGLPPVEREEPTETCGELMEKWLAGLTSRIPQDDRTRARRSLLPKLKVKKT